MSGFFDWLVHGEVRVTHIGSHGTTLTVISPLVVLLFLVSCSWAAWDATRRGKSASGTVLFTALAWWPVSLLWWLWLRPPRLPSEPSVRLKPWEYFFLSVLVLTFAGVLVFLSRVK